MLLRAGSFWIAAILLLIPAGSIAETYFEAAHHLLLKGQETEARRALELEIAIRPRNLEARYDLAILLERIGQTDDAIARYRENIKRGHHLPSVVNLSSLLRNRGQMREAEALLKQATQDFRSEAVPWYLLAEMAEKRNDEKQAKSLYLRAIKADKKNGFAQLRYARFLAARRLQGEAVLYAGRAVRLLPSCAPCLSIAGDIFAQAGKKKKALDLWKKSIAIEPDAALRNKILHAQNASR